jgi:hypothetical protein
MDEETKHVLASKTFWISALTTLVPLFWPPAGVWIAANPEVFSTVVGVVFGGLRFATSKPVRAL